MRVSIERRNFSLELEKVATDLADKIANFLPLSTLHSFAPPRRVGDLSARSSRAGKLAHAGADDWDHPDSVAAGIANVGYHLVEIFHCGLACDGG